VPDTLCGSTAYVSIIYSEPEDWRSNVHGKELESQVNFIFYELT